MTYQTIPMVSMASDEDMTGSSGLTWLRSRHGLASVVLSVTLLAVLVVTSGRSSNKNDAFTVNEEPLLLGSSGVASCTFDECFASNCNAEFAPYTCLFHNGGPHGGCSPTPWVKGTCTTQCDLSACDDYVIPDDQESCDTPCDESWCTQRRLCGHDVPFQCTEGASAFGCSGDEYQWTLRSASTACSSCCNINTC